jgi:hypothetical protein
LILTYTDPDTGVEVRLGFDDGDPRRVHCINSDRTEAFSASLDEALDSLLARWPDLKYAID